MVFTSQIAFCECSHCSGGRQANVWPYAFESRYNAVQYHILLRTSLQERNINQSLNHNRHPILRPNGRAIGVFCEYFEEIWPRYISPALYVYIKGILPKGPYPPCLRMADRALLAGYPRYALTRYCSLSIPNMKVSWLPTTARAKFLWMAAVLEEVLQQRKFGEN